MWGEGKNRSEGRGRGKERKEQEEEEKSGMGKGKGESKAGPTEGGVGPSSSVLPGNGRCDDVSQRRSASPGWMRSPWPPELRTTTCLPAAGAALADDVTAAP